MRKPSKLTAACVAAALVSQWAIAPIAAADAFRTPLDNGPQTMIYISKGFGATRDIQSAPKLGLRLQTSIDSAFDNSRFNTNWQPARTRSLIDLRWTRGYGESVRLLDAPVYLTPMEATALHAETVEESLESSGGYGKWILLALGIGAAACLFEAGICDSDGSSSPRNTDDRVSPGL